MANVESFNLDHTKVTAPYVRLAGSYKTPGGDTISKYDLRLTQPNAEPLPTGTVHTLEHLLAGYLRDHLDNILDVSPMGCRTGFYLLQVSEANPEAVLVAFKSALQDVADFKGTIPGVSELECGNYRDHSLEGALSIAASVLGKELHVQETIAIPTDASTQRS